MCMTSGLVEEEGEVATELFLRSFRVQFLVWYVDAGLVIAF